MNRRLSETNLANYFGDSKMRKILEELVKASFKGINKILEEDDIGHVYGVDTNVAMSCKNAIEILCHEEKADEDGMPNIVLVLDVVRRELDGLKRSDYFDVRADACAAISQMRKIMMERDAEPIIVEGYKIGVKLPGGSYVLTVPYTEKMDSMFPRMRPEFKADDQIVASMLGVKEAIQKEDNKEKLTLVTDDENLHLTCGQVGIHPAFFEEFYKDYDYDGFLRINVDEVGDQSLRKLLLDGTESMEIERIRDLTNQPIFPNQFVSFEGYQIDPNSPFRIEPSMKTATRRLYKFEQFLTERMQLTHNNGLPRPGYDLTWEQECALELLYDPRIDLVTISGPAGGGKTMLSLEAGYTAHLWGKRFRAGLLVANPPPDHGIHGLLPGDKDEKLRMENQNIFDALDFIFGMNETVRKTPRDVEEIEKDMLEKGLLKMESLTYIAGRTIYNRFMLFDEAQNYEPGGMMITTSRTGPGSKAVFCGDPYQVRNPRCNKTRNGLVYLMNRFKGQDNYGHITIKEVSRSRLAEQAGKLL